MAFGETAVADWVKIGLPALFFVLAFKFLFTAVFHIPGLTPLASFL